MGDDDEPTPSSRLFIVGCSRRACCQSPRGWPGRRAVDHRGLGPARGVDRQQRGHHRHDPARNWTRHDGIGQAHDVATAIQNEFGTNIAGVFDSDELRTQQTAAPLVTELLASGDNPVLKTFDGLNEIPAGAFDGDPTTSLEGILYLLGPLSWALGDVLVPDVGDPSVNGVTFDESFGGASNRSTTAPRARPAPRPMSRSPAKARSLSGR